MRIVWHIGMARNTYGRMENPDLLWTAMAEYAPKAVNSDTKVELRFLDRSASHFMYPYFSLVNNVLLVEDVLKCQEEGFDAVVLAAAIDPALVESRAAASIPVVGSVESAMVISQFIGHRVGIIGVRAGYVTMIDENIKRYGLRERMIDNRPVRLCELNYENMTQALKGDGAAFIAQIEQVARELIEEGADVLVSGCQFFGAVFNRLGYTGVTDQGVPIIDCAAAGLKMAESMVHLARSIGLGKSENSFSPYRSMDAALIKEVAAIRRS
jgi:allantoin racemase